MNPCNEKLGVVCAGMVTPAEVYVVDKLPEWNMGEKWKYRADFISDDAAIVATNLALWGVKAGLICNSFGQDITGQNLLNELEDIGIEGEYVLEKSLRTPYEIVISDSLGGRTYVWDRRDEILRTLFEASTKLIINCNYCYVDWYDLPYILPVLKDAKSNNVPVFINIEDKFDDPEILSVVSEYATYVQANYKHTDGINSICFLADLLFQIDVDFAVVTDASNGCMVSDGLNTFRVMAPVVNLIDANGAGAVFSAGLIYGLLHGWDLKEASKLAVAVASKKCELVGTRIDSLDESVSIARELDFELI
tara:strand:- start:676 stop:1596 length:921 start_codon:yes stop_codon:yes gene_type:complete